MEMTRSSETLVTTYGTHDVTIHKLAISAELLWLCHIPNNGPSQLNEKPAEHV
jgi:hypothetical protein